MRFEWNEEKNRRNCAKHKLSFEAAQFVFDDPSALSTRDRVVDGEERWQTIGRAAGISVLLVVHANREEQGEDVIRIITARKATPRERKPYEEGLKSHH
jgi:uncharacterized DUF497 family protein